MISGADRLIVIGLDGLNAEVLLRLVDGGMLPHLAALLERGAFSAALSAPPLDTPTNWTGISTGAWPGTHGITSFGIHMPGRDLDEPLLGGFNTELCRAEFLWDVAERMGATPFLFDYPVSWPPTVRKGIVARPTTMQTVWNPGYLWKGMGNFGPLEPSIEQHAAAGGYAWDKVYKLTELSVYPQEVQRDVVEAIGPLPQKQGGYNWTEEWLVRFYREHTTYLADMADYLLRTRGWGLLMCHLHAPDSLNHLLENAIWPDHPDYDPEEAAKVWGTYARVVGVLDEAIGRIAEECATERTAFAVVSDHGAVPCYKAFWINNVLCQAGLLAYRDESGPDGSWVDWTRTRAINSFTAAEHIWVNLKGRQPNGIVSPGKEYEQVREKVLQALYDARDPDTRECPVSLAARKEDAVYLGHWGDRCSDLVVFAKPEYYVPDFNHFQREGGYESGTRQLATLGDTVIEPYHYRSEDGWLWSWHAGGYHHGHLPTAALGDLTNRPFLLVAGPGVRQGYRREQAINLVDVAPTLAHIMGWPAPAQAEGAVRCDMLSGSD